MLNFHQDITMSEKLKYTMRNHYSMTNNKKVELPVKTVQYSPKNDDVSEISHETSQG